MHRMSGFDAAFVYDESPCEPQHTLKLVVFGPEASAAHSLEGMRRFVRARLCDVPPLRWRALRVPLDLHHPVWVDDPDIDLAHHVRRRTIPAPGGRDELCEVVSELASVPLDPQRPLWELWMLEGYEGGRVVAVLKLCHALADGGASRTLLERLFGDSASEATTLDVSTAPPLPSRLVLLRDALRDRLRDVAKLARLAVESIRARRRLRAAGLPAGHPGLRVSPLERPVTRFAGPLSSRRSFHFATLSMDHAREIRRAFGCTINDVLLATVAGAVRRYLRGRGELPGLPMIGWMPASIRGEGDGEWGNRVTARFLELPTHIEDPVERLRAAAAQAREVKVDLERRRGADLEDWLSWLPPAGVKSLSRGMRALVRLRPHYPGGVTVSNVPGPAVALQAPGGPVENLISVGHMKYAAGLNTTAWSYAGRFNVGLYACARAVPDPSRLSACIVEAFEDLHKAAAREATRLGHAEASA
jgi:diacylglycerol O-acyltransferase